jgi:formate dehydrogenase maturation protein FdhE
MIHRNLLFAHRQESLKQLAEDTNPLTAFHLTVLIIYIKVRNSIVHVPSRSASILLSQLKGRLNDQMYTKLFEFNELLTQYLQSKSQENEEENRDLLQQLQSALPQLKSLATSKELLTVPIPSSEQ